MSRIDERYHKLLRHIIRNGHKYEDPNRKGINRFQIPSATIEHNFEDGFPALTTKKLAWKSVVGELLWILRGDTNIKYLVDNGIPIWNKDAYNYYIKDCNNIGMPDGEMLNFKDWLTLVKQAPYRKESNYGNVDRNYGAQLRNWRNIGNDVGIDMDILQGIDQLANLIHTLKTNPMATKKTVTFWNPSESEDTALTPCHWSFECLVEPIMYNTTLPSGVNVIGYPMFDEPKYSLIVKWHQHSVDTFLGLPFNIASYALLCHILAKICNMVPKGIIGDFSNVHIYEPHMNAVKAQLNNSTIKHGKSWLNDDFAHHINLTKDVDHIMNSFEIRNFELLNYTSYPRIPAEMLAYNK